MLSHQSWNACRSHQVRTTLDRIVSLKSLQIVKYQYKKERVLRLALLLYGLK